MNSATMVFKNNYLLQQIYEFDNTYHLIYHDILDNCYSDYKNFWYKKLYKLMIEYQNANNYNEIINIFWFNYRISSRYII
jgi:hypothetical protein